MMITTTLSLLMQIFQNGAIIPQLTTLRTSGDQNELLNVAAEPQQSEMFLTAGKKKKEQNICIHFNLPGG